MKTTPKHLIILGTHGIPARHGGFETCAEHLAVHMVQHGWKVTVYGQADHAHHTTWQGVQCIYIKRLAGGLFGYLNPILHDLQVIWHARSHKAVFLTMGYNTALFNLILWFYRRRQIINMDGLEWKRSKYKRWHEKAWLRFNEWCALRIADTCIADHAAIADYLKAKSPQTSVTTIAYGADLVTASETDLNLLAPYGLHTHGYGLVIARPEPENAILEIVTAWTRSGQVAPLVVLGHYRPDHPYHAAVMRAAGPSVIFIGAIYDAPIVKTLRYHARMYLHGHQVGGTNPSLIEAMAAGRPIVAHDNVFNRGVCKDGALYFQTIDDLMTTIRDVEHHPELPERASTLFLAHYQWPSILQSYQAVLEHPA